MKAQGNRPFSILGRFTDLRMAMKVMAPDHDTTFILRPNGLTIRQMLNPHSRSVIVPDSGVLFEWGIATMEEAKLDAPRRYGLVEFRDGLLIAMLASRGRRLRSMALLRLGHELAWRGDRYRIELHPDQVKTNKYDAFDLPERLTPYIKQYIENVRPALLDDKASDVFWSPKASRTWSASAQSLALAPLLGRTVFGMRLAPPRRCAHPRRLAWQRRCSASQRLSSNYTTTGQTR